MRKDFLHSEGELMQGFRLGREQAFGYVFERLHPSLCFFAKMRVGDWAVAEGLVEDCFMRVWGKRAIFYEWRVLKAYLYRAVSNACVSWVRENRSNLTAFEVFEEHREEEFTPLQQIIRAEMVTELAAALDKLPPQRKKVFEMLYKEGKTVRETAEELELSINTINDHKRAGLVFLRKIMGAGGFLILLGRHL